MARNLRLNLIALLATAVAISSVPATAAAESTCDSMGGIVDANQVCQVHTTTPTYTINMGIPLGYPDQQAVLDYVTKDRASFLDWIAESALPGRNRPYTYDVTAKTYRSGTPGAGTQSLLLEIDNDTGLAHEGHPDTSYQAFNYDLGRHTPITFDTLFKPGNNPLAVLNPIVQHELGKHSYTPVRDDLDATTYQNFALTDDAVIFFFGQDQVVADNAGPHQVSVPRTELAPLLA